MISRNTSAPKTRHVHATAPERAAVRRNGLVLKRDMSIFTVAIGGLAGKTCSGAIYSGSAIAWPSHSRNGEHVS